MDFPTAIPFVDHLGVELLRFSDGEAELAVTPRAEHLNSWSVVHGGVTMTLLDVAMAHAARSPVHGAPPDARGVVTIEMKTSFMRAAEGRLRATGTLLHKTVTMAFTEGSVFNMAGQLCAHATGTFKYIKAVPGADRTVKAFVPPNPGSEP